MSIEIIRRDFHNKGKIYTVRINDKIIKILFLYHAIERIKRWGIKEEMVADRYFEGGGAFEDKIFKGS